MRSQKVLLAIVILAVLWFFGQLNGIGQKQEDPQKWTVETHDKTNFPLVGKHRTTSCADCHPNLVFEGTPGECEACHWERRQDDRYQLRLGMHCGDCHTPYSWKNVSPNKWNHMAATGYPLEGVHRTLDCVECHGEEDFDSSRIACLDCHDQDYKEARNPDHQAAGFPPHCQLCHFKQNTWDGAVYLHDRFILSGEHKLADCSDCHNSGQYLGLPTECVSCHLDDYNDAEDPAHQALNFPTDCVACHGSSSSTWEGASYAHTSFPLAGQHKVAQCSDCHPDGNYAGTSADCVSCHQNDYNNAEDPDHQALNFPTDCVACHGSSASTWEGANYTHTAFPLVGQHKVAQCSDCHPDGRYAGTSADCVSCHQDDYNNAEDPDHQALNFPTDCVACHGSSASTWEGANYTHTAFPLVGQHKVAQCSDCHPDGRYAGTSSDCVSCHQDDYNNAEDPDHQALNFPTDCVACHGSSASTWEGARFSHTSFPLVGQHQVAQCSDCHPNGIYAGTPSACVSCHLDDYNNTVDPNHQALNFSTVCDTCHGTSFVSWQAVTFDHSAYWPLRGAHTTLNCSSCHAQGYDLPRDCYGCHTQDYNDTADPDHSTAGFPTDCELCHYPAHFLWSQAVFDHQFPINSGKHSNADCTECHLTSNYREFSCLGCHPHNKNRMDNKHENVMGYAYESLACYACHPQGSD